MYKYNYRENNGYNFHKIQYFARRNNQVRAERRRRNILGQTTQTKTRLVISYVKYKDGLFPNLKLGGEILAEEGIDFYSNSKWLKEIFL